ncbi:MAG TPA: DinB family protein [Usitatibacter sp.]|nr:DinB family protein [Usitatibacter sp.]
MLTLDTPRLGLAESVERLEAMPQFLDAALASMDEAEMRVRPGAGEFSLGEHACHLRDLEREGYMVRVKRMLSEQAPRLEPFDGDAVAAARDYPSQDARAAAREFAAAREEVVRLIAPLTPEQLAREGTFGDRRVCFADVIAMMVEHDRGHREEIERLMDYLEE